MKYWNKEKFKREKWYKVISKSPFYETKIWCQQYNSTGKFYYSAHTDIWYFEKSEDALIFKIKYYG